MPPFFRQSAYSWQCDKCGVFFRAGKGGVCANCKRALCDEHLYGSFMDKLRGHFSSDRPICVECRSKGVA